MSAIPKFQITRLCYHHNEDKRRPHIQNFGCCFVHFEVLTSSFNYFTGEEIFEEAKGKKLRFGDYNDKHSRYGDRSLGYIQSITKTHIPNISIVNTHIGIYQLEKEELTDADRA